MGLFSRKPRETYVVAWDGSYAYEVLGESHHRSELLWLIQRAPEDQQKNGEIYTLAILEREPGNRYDKNAVRVVIDSKHVGYIPKEHARAVGDFVHRAEANGTVGTRAVIGWSTHGGDNAPIGVRLDLFDPKRGNTDVTLRTLDEIGPVNVRAPRAVDARTSAPAAQSRVAKPTAPPKPPQPKTLGPLLARASTENLTRPQYLRLAELADAFESACDDLADKSEVSIDDALALFASFGIAETGGFGGLDVSTELRDVSNCASDVSFSCNELDDEWDDSDKADRDDLRESVRDTVDTLLIELSTRLPVAAPVAAAEPAPVFAIETAPPPALPPAAWYPNPQGPGQRYWDGSLWTEDYTP